MIIGQHLQNFDIGAFTGLCTFEFENVPVANVPAVLDQITSPKLNHIKLSLACEADLKEGMWRTIPAILTRPNFQQLQTLEFDLKTILPSINHDDKQTKKLIQAELHMLELRGVTIRFTRPHSLIKEASVEASDEASEETSDEESGEASEEASDEASDEESGEASEEASEASEEVSEEVSDEASDNGSSIILDSEEDSISD